MTARLDEIRADVDAYEAAHAAIASTEPGSKARAEAYIAREKARDLLVASTPRALAFLLAEVERLTGALKEHDRVYQNACADRARVEDDLTAASKAVERLQGEAERARTVWVLETIHEDGSPGDWTNVVGIFASAVAAGRYVGNVYDNDIEPGDETLQRWSQPITVNGEEVAQGLVLTSMQVQA